MANAHESRWRFSAERGEFVRLFGAVSTLVLSSLVYYSQNWSLFPLVLLAGYATILYAIVSTTRITHDPFNPLTIILSLGLLRFCLPFVLLYAGVPRPYAARHLIDLLGLTRADLLAGHVFALVGLNAVIAGWTVLASDYSFRKYTTIYDDIPWPTVLSATVAALFGIASLGYYIAANAPLVETILNGSFRGVEITEGTGHFWYLGFLTVSGLLVLSSYLLSRRDTVASLAVVPALLTAIIYFVFGSRSRTILPIIVFMIIFWYCRRSRTSWNTMALLTYLKLGLSTLPPVLFLVYFVKLYEKVGLQAVSRAFTFEALSNYVLITVFHDIGHFSGLAGAAALEAGELHGGTFKSALLWPISEFVPTGEATGEYIVKALTSHDSWGIGPALIGDAYVNFGFVAIILSCGLFGFVLKILYCRLRTGKLQSVLYGIVFVYMVRIYFSSITKWGEMWVVVGFAIGILALGRLFAEQSRNLRTPPS